MPARTYEGFVLGSPMGPGVGGGGAGETLVYGPDAFTAADGTALSTYDANWAALQGALSIFSNAISPTSANAGRSRWTGVAVTDGRVKGRINTGNAVGTFPGLCMRIDASNNCYAAEWDKSANAIVLYRVTASGGTSTEIARGGAVADNTTYTNCYIKVTGTSPVAIECGDDTNGAAAVTFSDSDAARRTSGAPGVSHFPNADHIGWVDDVSIYTIP